MVHAGGGCSRPPRGGDGSPGPGRVWVAEVRPPAEHEVPDDEPVQDAAADGAGDQPDDDEAGDDEAGDDDPFADDALLPIDED